MAKKSHMALIRARRRRRQRQLAKRGFRSRQRGRVPPVAVLVTPVFADGGTERWTLDLFQATAGRVSWSDLVVLSRKDLSQRSLELAQQVVRVSFGAHAAVSALANADVAVVWGTDANEFWNPCHQARLVAVAHGDGSSSFTRAVMSANADADVLACASPEALATIPASARKSARVLLNGVNLERLEVTRSRADMRRELGLADKRIAGYVGRLSWEKNPYGAIAAIGRLPDWHLVIAGDGPERAEVRRFAADRAPGRVHFLGVRRDVGNLLGAFDLLVAPSTQEGFGFSIAEAWAAGCPVVATRVGIVKLWPQFARPVPVAVPGGIQSDVRELRRHLMRQDGVAIAEAIEAGVPSDVVERAREHARTELSLTGFGQRWSNLLCELATPSETSQAVAAPPVPPSRPSTQSPVRTERRWWKGKTRCR